MSKPHDLARLATEYNSRRARLAGRDIYSLFNPGHLFAVQQRQRVILATLKREGLSPLAGRTILEVGCGSGQMLHELMSFGARPADLHAAELLPWRIAEAQDMNPSLALTCADGQTLPFGDASFDLVLQFTVFTSILDDRVRQSVAREMVRVLRSDGMILWYDYWLNPPNHATRGIRPAEIRRLFPGCRFHFQRITLAPPIARALAGRSWLLCGLLERMALLNTHYLVTIRTA